jgi:hypothetical protein
MNNIVIFNDKLLLIDADHLTKWGSPRTVFTPGINISSEDYDKKKKGSELICN